MLECLVLLTNQTAHQAEGTCQTLKEKDTSSETEPPNINDLVNLQEPHRSTDVQVSDIASSSTGRQTLKRKNPVVIYDCICGEVVSQRHIQERSGVIECKRIRCETRWVRDQPIMLAAVT